MERSGYENITFIMKPNYTKKDLVEVLQMFKSAFDMYNVKLEPDNNSPARCFPAQATNFTIYFQRRRTIT